jgi:hypothetical protein
MFVASPQHQAVMRASPAIRSTGERFHLVDDFVVLGKSTDVKLVPDLLTIDMDVEHAARSFDQLGVHGVFRLDRFRQTGGLGIVVSLHAVLDADLHGYSLFLSNVISRYSLALARPLRPFLIMRFG